MARANLNIQTQINEEFLRAQDSGDVRLLKVKIQDEDLILDGIVNKVGTPSDDFNTVLLDSIADDQALFVLFRASDDSQESSPWCMVAWVPDGCRVRDKMLYSSSREDLKRSLGLGFFKSEYAANQRSDLTWSQYQHSLDRNFDADVLTESERLVLEEKQQVQAESAVSKSSALSVLPFAMTSEVTEQLNAFKEGTCNWVEMTITNEIISLVGFRSVTADDSFQSFIDSENASFIGLKLPKGEESGDISLFIFSCPENSPVRVKMTMSSSKASVLAAAQQLGITFDKTLEIRDADEVDEAVRSARFPRATDSPVPGGSSAAAGSHGKPQRPGRAGTKTKVSKFKLDEA